MGLYGSSPGAASSGGSGRTTNLALAIMLIAFGLMHVPFKWKRETGPDRAKKTGIVTLVVLALVVTGILRLPFPFFGGSKAVPASTTAPASTTP